MLLRVLLLLSLGGLMVVVVAALAGVVAIVVADVGRWSYGGCCCSCWLWQCGRPR